MRPTQLAKIDLNLLVIADTLFETRSVTATAEAVHLSQPAVSRALSRLRDQLGKELMVRDRRGIKLTPFAEALRPQLRAALLSLQRAVQSPQPFDPKAAVGTLTIASQDYAAFTPLPEVLEELAREAPRIDLVMVPYREPFEELLETSEVDLVIGPRPSERSWIVSRPLLTHGWVVVGRRGHPYFRRPSIDAFVAASHALVSPRGQGLGVVDAALARKKRARRICLRVPDFAGALAIVARSDLLTVVPEGLATPAAKVLPLESREPPLALEPTRVYASYHLTREEDARHAWLRDRVLRTAS
ncbi:MAG: LysR family transcriptional regulator [Deltaproteobacteria bacterium]|nr:LysR family transcriptional regulator [Deltaproteobacteria bacterium]